MSFADHFSAAAEGYATFRPCLPSELSRWLGEEAKETDSLAELGCGSGQWTRSLADVFGHVSATDASARQLERAPKLANVTYRVEAAEELSLPRGSQAVVCAGQAAHWFRLNEVFPRVRQALRPGGVFALACYGPPRAPEPVQVLWDRFHDETLAPHWPPARRHVIALYQSLPFPFDEIRVPHFEIHRDWSLEEALGYVNTWSGVRELEAAGHRRELDRFVAEVRRAWGPADKAGRFSFPVGVRATRL